MAPITNMPANPRINAPGVSQRHRLVDAVQPENIRIDGSTLADRLLFIAGLSRQINFFDANLNTANWTPFFEKSVPFVLARLIKTDLDEMSATLVRYAEKVESQPEVENLRILADYVALDLFGSVNSDYLAVSEHPNDFTVLWSNLIRANLRQPLLDFIASSNGLVRYFDFPQRRFWDFYNNGTWDIESTQDLFSVYPAMPANVIGKTALIKQLAADFLLYGNRVLDVLREVVGEASNWLNDSLEPLREELRQLHEPHLGLLFAFLRLFELFGGDLNALSKKHLEFFFKDVLNLVPEKAVPDQAHLIIEIQKNLERYQVPKGTSIKDGKDNNKADVYFALDEEIVVDKAKVESLMTLFLNPVEGNCVETSGAIKKVPYTEGVYMAPVANTADGKGEPFTDAQSKNWSTLGNKSSKRTPKGKRMPQNHPPARMGFVLASPVLFLQEGKRRITFKLTCEGIPGDTTSPTSCSNFKNSDLFNKIEPLIDNTFYVITEEAIKAAQKEGLSVEAADIATAWLQERSPYTTWSDEEPYPSVVKCAVVPGQAPDPTAVSQLDAAGNPIWKTAESLINSFKAEDQVFLKAATARKIFSLKLSGEKEWLSVPLTNITFDIVPSPDFTNFTLTAIATLPPETPAVTFFDKIALKEDFRSDLPAAKFELDPDIKVWCPTTARGNPECCFERDAKDGGVYVSLYQVFSNTNVTDCNIEVVVCGVRKLVVQNDEALQDVNSPILPFGPRPKLGANFFIGSNEVFGKNWQAVRVNVEWKDRPINFFNHYKFYFTDIDKFEDGSSAITDSSFKVKTALLNNFSWLDDGVQQLYPLDYPPAPFCPRWAPISLPPAPPPLNPQGLPAKPYNINTYHFDKSAFTGFTAGSYIPLSLKNIPFLPLNTSTTGSFLRLTMQGVSFQHERYGFELARQMMMLAGLVDPTNIKVILEQLAPILDPTTGVCAALKSRFDQLLLPATGRLSQLASTITNIMKGLTNTAPPGIKELVVQIDIDITAIRNAAQNALNAANSLSTLQLPAQSDIAIITTFISNVQTAVDLVPLNSIPNLIININTLLGSLTQVGTLIHDAKAIDTLTTSIKDLTDLQPPAGSTFSTIVATAGIKQLSKILCDSLIIVQTYLTPATPVKFGLPLEPYTPTIKELFIDYRAIADVKDMHFLHLYPYENTHKTAFIPNHPTLIATSPLTALLPEDVPTTGVVTKQGLNHPAEGTLFIGLKNLTPGANLSLLFQLAESTANTESEKARVAWQYLSNNEWKDLREGFEILNDATEGLTSTGIVKIAVPTDITNGPENTVMPRDFHWLKVAALANADAVCETIGIHAQAVHATFTIRPENDTNRLAKPLEAGKLAKLEIGNGNIKQVQQLYQSFGGKAVEANDHYYQRASERLRHKGRAINLFDYERLVLQAFPQIFKAKCIPHTLALGAKRYQRDAEWSAGFVTVAVVPDLLQLLPGENLYPRAPLSLLDQIRDYLCRRNSPFAKLKVMNPRYEGVDVLVRVRFREGYDQIFYREQLRADLISFLAPWSMGDSEKLRFGQPLYRSDLLKYVETLFYVDFLTHLEFWHEEDKDLAIKEFTIIEPRTARSILAPGNIIVCEPEAQQCLEYDRHRKVPDCGIPLPDNYYIEEPVPQSPQST